MTKGRNFVHGGGLIDRDLSLTGGLLDLIQVPRRPDLVTACMTERGTGNGRQQTHVRPMPRKVAGWQDSWGTLFRRRLVGADIMEGSP